MSEAAARSMGRPKVGDDAVRDARYLDVLPLPSGGYRIWYEGRLRDDWPRAATEPIESPTP